MAKHPNYEVFEELGRGENSVVFRAWDLALSRDVAIKELKSDPGSDGGQADTQRIKQFLKEASFLAQFEHENVLRIHTVDLERGWIVMELMKGSLTNQIATEPMPADTVRSVLRQMLTALDFLHQKGKVHGAVRPSNILINEHGTVKLSDFEASSRDGELPVPKGSKKYLAPELIRTGFGEFGSAVDLYCLGFTALELLKGKKFDSLFPGTGEGAIDEDVAWLRWHSSDAEMSPMKEIAPEIPNDLARVIDQLLKKSVEDRPQDAAAVLKLLDDAPLVPVQVPEVATKVAAASDVSAMLPTKAVKLPTAVRTRPSRKVTPAPKKATGKDKLNETLGKPYVLWPICIAMLVAALFLGLHLRGDKGAVAGLPVDVPIEKPIPPAVQPQPLKIALDVVQGTENAKLLVGGESKDFGNLKLLPGEHDVVVIKDGFEKFVSSLKVDPDNTSFEIELTAIVEPEPVKPKEPMKPSFVDIRVALSPANAELFLDGRRVLLQNGMLRIDPEEVQQLELAANSEGYEPKTASWSLAEIARQNYSLKISLDEVKTAPIRTVVALPDSLYPFPGSAIDEQTGLPLRALSRILKDSAPLELALVKAGKYQFGVPGGERRTWELGSREIKIAKPFYMGINEVTASQFTAFERATEKSGSDNDEENLTPCSNVSVKKAAEFCQWVGGRLPTEKEWEAAVRGRDDSGYPLPWGAGGLTADKCRLFRGETGIGTSAVHVSKQPSGANSIGLLNTIGNVAEWCDNQSGGDEFIVKGCSYKIPPGNHVRVTWRNSVKWTGAADIGLRLMVPVYKDLHKSAALAFAAPTNIETFLVSNRDDSDGKPKKAVYTKTVNEIAEGFTGPAELVIDSGGFMSEITDVRFSPGGQQVAACGEKEVRIWSVETGKLLQTLRGDMSRTSYGNVNTIAWSPDGESLLVGVSDYRKHGNIRVYDTSNFDEIAEVLTGHTAPCRKLVFSRDSKQLVSVDAEGLVLVRDWSSREILHRITARDAEKPIFDVVKFPIDGPFLIGVDFLGPQVISTRTGKRLSPQDKMPGKVHGWLVDVYNKLIKLPYGAKGQPRVMDFRMEEGRWVGAGSGIENGRSKFWVRVWESRDAVSSATPAKEIAAYDKHLWKVTAVSLQPNGSLVASADKFGDIHVWDSYTGKRKFKFSGQGKPIYEVAFDENSTRLAFGTRPYAPKTWNRNHHGDAIRVLDLGLRAITDVASRKEIQLRREQPVLGQSSVAVEKRGASYYVNRLLGKQLQSQYRISSGRNPTVFTMLDQPKLDVEKPVIFGDGEGLLAMWDSSTDELKRAFIGHGGLVSAISSSNNGKLIATSSTDRTIRLWSLEDYDPTGFFDFKFENSAVREVISGSSSEKAGVKVGDRIMSIDGKSLTELFDLMLLGKAGFKPGDTADVTMKRDDREFTYSMTMADGYDFSEPILNFYVGDEGQWIIWHPQGYYDASPGADRLIGWHLNRGYDKAATYFEVQQFRKKLYRPDVINGILEKGSLEEALAALKGNQKEKEPVDFREPKIIAEYHPPVVRITSPTDNWQTESKTVTVKGEAQSVNGLPLTALTLLHNGSVAKVFRPTEINQLRMEIAYEMQLSPGNNDLVLIAANVKSSSQGEHIVVGLNQPTSRRQMDAIVLSIGVSDFEGSLGQLTHAAADAEAFAKTMKSHENGQLYGNVKTKLLAGKVADNEILDGFQWLSENTKDGDVAVVFVASRGLMDRRDNFYIGASNSNERKARSTAVSWRDLMDTLQLDLPDCKRMVFLDLEPTKNSIKPGLRNPLLDLAAPEMGTIFLSSNTLQQKPVQLASSDKSAFMRAVLETVSDRKYDTKPGDMLFNPLELAAGVTTRVKDLTQDQQQPIFFTPEYAKLANVMELRK